MRSLFIIWRFRLCYKYYSHQIRNLALTKCAGWAGTKRCKTHPFIASKLGFLLSTENAGKVRLWQANTIMLQQSTWNRAWHVVSVWGMRSHMKQELGSVYPNVRHKIEILLPSWNLSIKITISIIPPPYFLLLVWYHDSLPFVLFLVLSLPEMN